MPNALFTFAVLSKVSKDYVLELVSFFSSPKLIILEKMLNSFNVGYSYLFQVLFCLSSLMALLLCSRSAEAAPAPAPAPLTPALALGALAAKAVILIGLEKGKC